MTRPLYAFERFTFVGLRRPWNVLVAVRRPGRLDRMTLVAALAALQDRHPMLRLGVADRDGRPAFTPHSAPIPLRVVEHAEGDAWFDTMIAELERPFEPQPGPLARLVWLRCEASSDLILICHHGICDGTSKLLLIAQLLDALERCEPRRPTPPIPFTLAELFGDPPSGRERLRIRLSAAAARLFVDFSPRPDRSPGPPPPHYALRWTIAGEAFARLRERCRRESVTPYTAVATALLRALRAVDGPRSRGRLLCPVGIRRFVPRLRPETIFPYAPNVTLSLASRLDHDFWAQARRLRADLASRRARLDPKRLIWTAERLHDRCDRFIDQHLQGRTSEHLLFTHLGQVELPHGARALGSFASVPWPERLAISSFQQDDRMELTLLSRPNRMPQATAERIRDDAGRCLAAQLDGTGR